MSDIKAALQAEIEKLQALCDDIPFGLCEEDMQLLGVMRDAVDALSQRDAQIAALAKQEPAYYVCDDGSGLEVNKHNEFSCGRIGFPVYRAAPPATVKLPEYDKPKHIGVTWDDGYNHGVHDCAKAIAEQGYEVADE